MRQQWNLRLLFRPVCLRGGLVRADVYLLDGDVSIYDISHMQRAGILCLRVVRLQSGHLGPVLRLCDMRLDHDNAVQWARHLQLQWDVHLQPRIFRKRVLWSVLLRCLRRLQRRRHLVHRLRWCGKLARSARRMGRVQRQRLGVCWLRRRAQLGRCLRPVRRVQRRRPVVRHRACLRRAFDVLGVQHVDRGGAGAVLRLVQRHERVC